MNLRSSGIYFRFQMKRSQVDDARGDGSCAVARAEPADPRNCKANGAFAEGKPDDSVLSWTRPRNGEPISSISPTTDRRTLADFAGVTGVGECFGDYARIDVKMRAAAGASLCASGTPRDWRPSYPDGIY